MAQDSKINLSDVDRESSIWPRALMDNMQRELSGLIGDTQTQLKIQLIHQKEIA